MISVKQGDVRANTHPYPLASTSNIACALMYCCTTTAISRLTEGYRDTHSMASSWPPQNRGSVYLKYKDRIDVQPTSHRRMQAADTTDGLFAQKDASTLARVQDAVPEWLKA